MTDEFTSTTDSVPVPYDTHFTRRTFLTGTLASAVVLHLPLAAHSATKSATKAAASQVRVPGVRRLDIDLKVNGAKQSLKGLDTRTTLLDALRDHLDLTGSKKGCDHGQCGACTVLVDGQRINSCLTLAAQNQGKDIVTIEGLAHGDKLHPMQTAFIENDALQCGFCTPGQILSAVGLLKEGCGPGEAEVRECMSGNICRCGAYRNILKAIEQVRKGGQVATL